MTMSLRSRSREPGSAQRCPAREPLRNGVVDGHGQVPRNGTDNRVLVVSFYHGKDGYRESVAKISKASGRAASVAPISLLRFYPGELDPAVALQKIESHLDTGSADGRPFTGMLVDGIHNALLAFPRIARAPNVWTMLIALARAYGTTLVTTYSAMVVQHASPRGNYTFGGEAPNGAVVEDTLLARSNTTVIFGETAGQMTVSVPDCTVIRQARDVVFLWRTTTADFAHGRPVVLRDSLDLGTQDI